MCINIASKKKKEGRQEIQGVIVTRENGEFIFNYNTSKDPAPDEMDILKMFRNRFVDELKQVNDVLGRIPD